MELAYDWSQLAHAQFDLHINCPFQEILQKLLISRLSEERLLSPTGTFTGFYPILLDHIL